MKKLLSVLLVVCMLVSMMPSVLAADAETSGTCGDAVTWSFDEATGTLEISGSGAMTEFTSSNAAPWKAYRDAITEIVIGEEVTSIGKFAFNSCTNVKHLDIPDSVTTIGASAFKGCTGLVTVVIGDGVTTIGKNAFDGCAAMLAVSFGTSVADIDASAFYGCGKLAYAFYNGSSNAWDAVDAEEGNEVVMEDLDVVCTTSALTGDIESDVSWSMDPRTYVMIFSGEGEMADYAGSMTARSWNDYKHIVRDVVVEDGVTHIGGGAFRQFTNMRTITIADSVLSIGARAFDSCSSLTDVYYGSTPDAWAAVTIDDSYNAALTGAVMHYAGDCNHTVTETVCDKAEGNVHTLANKCKGCGEMVGTTATEACADGDDEDALCDKCGDTIETGEGGGEGDETCTHTNTTTTYSQNKDGLKHSFFVICDACQATVTEGEEACADGDDEDELCDKCGETISAEGGEGGEDTPCTEHEEEVKYETMDGEKHKVLKTCKKCEAVISTTAEGCVDEDKDNACDKCEGVVTKIYWKLEEGVLTVWGNTAMEDYASLSGAPWYSQAGTVTEIVIEGGITHIGARSFYRCENAEKVTIPASVKSIGKYAFYRCGGLKNVDFGGTKAQWDALTIGSNNEKLTGATIKVNCLHEKTATKVVANADKTHTITVTCDDCGGTVSENTVACTAGAPGYAKGSAAGKHVVTTKCTYEACGQTLSSEEVACANFGTAYSPNSDRTHDVIVTCKDCKEISTTTIEKCVNENDDMLCDQCGTDLTCAHPGFVMGYVSNKDHATHDYGYVCTVCGALTTALERNLPCAAEAEGDWNCDLCEQDFSCQHDVQNTSYDYIVNDDRTHTVITIITCANEDCDVKELSRQTAEAATPCTDGRPADDYCDVCGANLICDHAVRGELEYIHNGYKKHHMQIICQICGDDLVDTDVDCVDRKGAVDANGNDIADGACDLCGGQCKHKLRSDWDDGDGMQHEKNEWCTVRGCDYDVYVMENCADQDLDGLCDKCGYDVYVATDGEEMYYADELAEAFNAGGTISLLRDVKLQDKLVIDGTVTLDLGEYSLTTTDVGEDNYSIVINGDVTIKSGTFNIAGLYGMGTSKITGGKLTIEGGEFNFVGDSDYLIGNWGTLTITGGKFNAQYCAVNNFEGTTTITGGTFLTEEKDCTGLYDSEAVLSGGTTTITGGTFSTDVKALCAEGYTTAKNADDTYTVQVEDVKKVSVSSMSMVLDSELLVNFNVKGLDLAADTYTAYITGTDGSVIEITEENFVTSGTTVRIPVPVAAKELADTMAIVIKDSNGNVVNNAYSGAARDYALRGLASDAADAKLKTLLIDMLNYGAAAQVQFNYNTDALANAGTEAYQQYATTAYDACVNGQDKGLAYGKWGAWQILLESKIEMNVFWTGLSDEAVKDMSAKVEYVDHKGVAQTKTIPGSEFIKRDGKNDQYGVYIDFVAPADCRSLITVTAYNADGTVYAVSKDSVEGYVARVQAGSTDAVLLNMVDMMIKFVDASAAQFN